jgi:nucleoside-diphosphate-sugar epimerase
VAPEATVRAAEGVAVIVVRPPYLWSPGEHGHVAAYYGRSSATAAVCYIGQGLNCHSHLHVSDAAHLILTTLKTGKSGALHHGR